MKIIASKSFTLTGTAPVATVLLGAEERIQRLGADHWPQPQEETVSTFLGQATATTWRWSLEDGFELELVRTELHECQGVTLRARIHNGSGALVRLRSLHLMDGGELLLMPSAGEAGDWMLAPLRGSGDDKILPWTEERISQNERTRRIWKSYNMPIPFELPTDEKANDGRWRNACDGFSVVRVGGQDSLVMQAVGPGDVDLTIDYQVLGTQLRLEIAAAFSDVLLEPGESRSTDELLMLAGGWQESCKSAFRWVAATHGARTDLAPLGWCSWYDLFMNVTAKSTHESAEGLCRLRPRLQLGFFQLDDGYQRTVGDWRPDPRPSKFPGGFAPFVHDAASLGARPGIWVAPLAVHESSPLFKSHPEYMQKDAAGEFSGQANNWGPVARWLDPTHPGAQAWIRQLLRELRSQGFTYFKIDFNNIQEKTRWYDSTKTRLQVYRDLYQLYREELGEQTYLLCCGAYTLRAPAGFVDAFRIGPDSGAVWEYGDYPCSIGNCVRAVVQTAPAHGILYVNDPDVTYLRPRDTLVEHERRSWHGFVGLLGGLVAVSEPMGRPDFAEAAPMLQMLNPPVPERGQALHGAADPQGRLFGFTARRSYGDFAVVQLHNPATASADITLVSADTGLAGPVHVWSFWDTRYCGIVDGAFTAHELLPRGADIVRLTPVSTDRPVIVGSDLHIGCGAAEIIGVEWEAITSKLTIRLDGNAGRDYGSIWLATPWNVPPLPLQEALEIQKNLDCCFVALGGGLHVLQIKQRVAGQAQQVRLTLNKPLATT